MKRRSRLGWLELILGVLLILLASPRFFCQEKYSGD